VEGARNVFLETVKRGEDDLFEEAVNLDDKSATTVILRLYEAYGGRAQARLLISHHLPVLKAITINLLEDEDEELYVLRFSDSSDVLAAPCR
jgi:alpha-mannosidase